MEVSLIYVFEEPVDRSQIEEMLGELTGVNISFETMLDERINEALLTEEEINVDVEQELDRKVKKVILKFIVNNRNEAEQAFSNIKVVLGRLERYRGTANCLIYVFGRRCIDLRKLDLVLYDGTATILKIDPRLEEAVEELLKNCF